MNFLIGNKDKGGNSLIPQTIILNTAAGEQNVQLFCKPGEMSYAFRFKIANSSGFMDLSSYEKILLGIDVGKRFSTQIGTLIDDDTIEVSIAADSLSSLGNFPCCLILVNGITELRIGGNQPAMRHWPIVRGTSCLEWT